MNAPDGDRSCAIELSANSRQGSAFIRPDTSSKIGTQDRRGRVLHASISLVVIGFAASISTAAAQYLSPQPPPVGYPPSAYYPYRGYPPPEYYPYRATPAPYQGIHHYPDADEEYDDPYDPPYPSQPTIGDAQRPPGSTRSEPLAPPASPQDRGTAVAALPPEYQPERGPAKELSPRFYRTVVNYPTIEPSGTIIIDTPNTYLYLTLGNGKGDPLRRRRRPRRLHLVGH